MSASMANMCSNVENKDEEITVSIRAGSNLVRAKALFSLDSKFLFCCAEKLVKVFSCNSGECVRNLNGHTLTVTGLMLNPHNKLQLLSCSKDQTVIFWDYEDGILLKSLRLKSALFGILPLGHDSHSVMVLEQGKKEACNFVRYDDLLLTRTVDIKNIHHKVEINEIGEDAKCIAVGCKGEFVVAVHERILIVKPVLMWKEKNQKQYFLDTGPSFTCVTCHPTEYCIATGDSNGRIILWWNFMEGGTKVIKMINHWHSLPVLDLMFTPEGSYLLSGGHECVLVKWQSNSDDRNYLPRLGAPLCHIAISQDNCMYATSHHDNVIQLISSHMKSLNVYQGLTKAHLDSQLKRMYPTGLLCDPRSKALVLNGRPGHIQMYSVHSDRQLYNLDIVGQNYISPENLKRPLVVTEVVNAAFDSSGFWMATVEEWNDRVMSPEVRLKFWYYNEQSRQYTLNTIVEYPHRDSVTCLKFRPRCHDNSVHVQPMAVTSSSGDKRFKTWLNVDDTDIYRANTKWSCESVGYYRDRPAGKCCFSVDGSLLAVVFECTVTLWDPANNVLKQSLVHQSGGLKHVRYLEFGNKSCSHLLVSTTQSAMVVWNLMSCSVSWTVDLDVTSLISDPLSDVMAVCCSEENLFVFRPSDPSPLFSKKQISDSSIISGVFIPHLKESCFSKSRQLSWQSHSQLYLMNKQQDLLTIAFEEQDKEDNTHQMKLQQNLPQTPFSLLLNPNKKHGNTRFKPAMGDNSVYKQAKEFTKELLSTPSHVQPPVTSLCQRFIHSLLISKQQKHVSESDESDEDAEESGQNLDLDSDMEVDEVHTDKSQQDSVIQKIKDSDKQTVKTTKHLPDNLLLEGLDWYDNTLKS